MKYELTVDGINVESDYNVSENEVREYIKDICEETHKDTDEIDQIKLTLNKKEVAIDYQMKKKPFERIRRITGYLVGSVNRWNNSKRAELRDRVKHSTCGC